MKVMYWIWDNIIWIILWASCIGLIGPPLYKFATWNPVIHFHHTYDIEPLNKKGLRRIQDKYSDWVKSPYDIGDTINVSEQGKILDFESQNGFTKKYIIKSIKTEEY